MIPMIAKVRVEDKNGKGVWLVLPLFLLWLLLLPFAIVLLPFVVLALWIQGIQPFRALSLLWALFCSLSGMVIDVDQHGQDVKVHIV